MPRKPPATKPTLAVVTPLPANNLPRPPCKLGATGLSLWRDILSAYDFGDRASLETLAQACASADRAEACRKQIDSDGELIRTKTGVRDHPLLKHELAARAFVVRSLARLGLDLEPVRPAAGRPPSGAVGLDWRQLQDIKGA
jgi:hypothetical protein